MSLRLVRRALFGGGAAVVAVRDGRGPFDGVVSATPVPQWIPNAAVHALASDGAYVYAAGIFTSLKSPTSNATRPIPAWCGSTWRRGAGPDLDPERGRQRPDHAPGPDRLGALHRRAFTTSTGSRRSRLAGISTSGSGALTSWNPDANFTVNALALNGSQVVIAGKFTHIAKTAQKYLAQVTSGGTIVSSFRPALNAGASPCLGRPAHPFIVVGGAFDTIGGASSPMSGPSI